MKILGIDYGRRKIGLSVADTKSKLAQPLKVLKVETNKDAFIKLKKVVDNEAVEKLVVGISEGKMADETKIFVKGLIDKVQLTVILHDETLSTQKAQELSIKAGIKRKKRKALEDAYASAVMLQDYLDEL